MGDRISLGTTSWAYRAYHWFVYVSLLLIGVAATWAGLSILDEAGGKFVLAIGVLTLIGTEIARRAHRGEIDPGFLELDAVHLQINHPQLFKETLTVSLSQVRAVVIDEPLDDDYETPGFPFLGESSGPLRDRVRGYLWNREELFPFRVLGLKFRRPNMLILFNAPAVPAVHRETEWGPKRREALAGVAMWTPVPAHAREVISRHRLRQVINVDDLQVAYAIGIGEIAASDPKARTGVEADRLALVKSGWAIAALGLLFPFVSIWTLPIARFAWNRREYVHAIGMTLFALVVVGGEAAILSSSDGEYSWRFAVGIGVTAFFGILFLVGLLQRQRDQQQ